MTPIEIHSLWLNRKVSDDEGLANLHKLIDYLSGFTTKDLCNLLSSDVYDYALKELQKRFPSACEAKQGKLVLNAEEVENNTKNFLEENVDFYLKFYDDVGPTYVLIKESEGT